MDFYEILGINSDASETDIKKAYHKLALLYHPDRNKDVNAKEKFQNIQSAYQILIDNKSRINYNKLDINEQHNFVKLLQKIFNNSLNINELNNFGIKFEKNDLDYLESNLKDLINALNINEIFDFIKGKFIRKKIDIINTEDTDTSIWSENYETYYDLPFNYQRINDLDIRINLEIKFDDLFENNKKKIKIKRTINNKNIINMFIFNIEKPYIVFPFCGDVNQTENGHLIIKLNFGYNYIWYENLIIIEKNITLYELIYGLDLSLDINKNENIIKYIPSRDGLLFEINKLNNYIITYKLILNYEHTEDKEQLLNIYFN
jgi:curved DNA-binding protein CbpA